MPAWATALISTVTPGTIIALGLFAIRMYFKKQKTDGVRIEKFKEKHPITADLLETMQCSLLTEASKKFTDFVEREDGLIDKLRSKEINYRSLPQREKKLVMQFAKEAIRDITPKPNLYQVFTHKTITPEDVLVLDDQLEDIANKIAANFNSRITVTSVGTTATTGPCAAGGSSTPIVTIPYSSEEDTEEIIVTVVTPQ